MTDQQLAPIPETLLDGLNPAQRDAVETLYGPLLIVAGPGSGKTRVLTHRIAALIATGAATPEQILAVTFTNRAASEMRERVVALVGPSAWSMWVSTFHSACVKILRVNADLVGLPTSFTIVDAGDARSLISKVLADANPNAPVEKDTIKEAQMRISLAKNADQTSADVAEFSEHGWVAPVMDGYNRRLRAMGAVDFDDILLHCLTLLRDNPAVAQRWRDRFRHVLVDEFQDTNTVQYRILRYLAQGADSFCVVGDGDQSIYRFRGATPEVLTAFADDEPATKIVVLNENYRSTPAILRTVQAIIDANPSPQRAHLTTSNAEGVPVRLVVAQSNRDEARFVITEIKNRLAKDPDSGPYAILMRTNFQTRSFEEELTKAAMRYQVLGALRFYDRAEVKDALSYLRTALNPTDKISLARCLNTPRRGIGKVTGELVMDAANPIDAIRATVSPGSVPGLAALAVPKAALAPLANFLNVLDHIARACEEGPSDALRVVSGPAGLRTSLAEMKIGGEERVDNLDELIRSAADFAKAFSERDPRTMSTVSEIEGVTGGLAVTLAYLENVALISSNDVDTEAADTVLLSAHASKGKEFPHVYVTGVEEGLFPHTRSLGASGIQEERRLLFVAASRAERSLTLTRCAERWMFGETKPAHRSRFLADLPEDVEEFEVDDLLPKFYQPQRAFGNNNANGGYKKPWPPKGSSNSDQPRAPRAGEFPARRSTSTQPLRTSIMSPRPVPTTGPSQRLTVAQVRVGQRVEHAKYGIGVIHALRVAENVAVITFDEGRKDMNLNFAPLKLVD